MSGRGRGRGCGSARGNQGQGGRSGQIGRGCNYSGTGGTKHKGLCVALSNNVFDYGQKGAADQMRIMWEKIVHHVGTIYGHDISNELQNKKIVLTQEPSYSQEVLDKHADRVKRKKAQYEHINDAWKIQAKSLDTLAKSGDINAVVSLAELQNKIDEATYKNSIDLPIHLDEMEKTLQDNKWQTYHERQSCLEKQRGQAFSVTRGQCMQALLDKMKHDPDWTAASVSCDPLNLCQLIEKTILAQTEDQYPFATVYEQECALCSFNQNDLSNKQWHECFNTKIDIGNAIGATQQHKVLLQHVAAKKGTTKFNDLTDSEQAVVREEAEEQYLSCVFLRQSGKQHNKLKVDLQNDFTTGDDRYPKN